MNPMMAMMGGMNPMMGCMGGGMDPESMGAMMAKQQEAYAKSLSASLSVGASVQSSSSEEIADRLPVSSASSSTNRSNVLSMAYRPPGADPIYGITDRRFEGVIRSFSDKEGYGFLRCPDFDKAWTAKGNPKCDVFMHRNQKGHFDQGDTVSFEVFKNFRGKPQATDLREVKRD
mmetsp:Transcript_73593/g.193051  ORF Transcript_73593/g.193051 Transcript_73593/m.193051 type:complete len:174 (-) Transcript_73593:31-552(-)